MDIVQQLCIKTYEIRAQNGDYFVAEQGKFYTTSVPKDDMPDVTVFGQFWVPVPKEHFVLAENQPYRTIVNDAKR